MTQWVEQGAQYEPVRSFNITGSFQQQWLEWFQKDTNSIILLIGSRWLSSPFWLFFSTQKSWPPTCFIILAVLDCSERAAFSGVCQIADTNAFDILLISSWIRSPESGFPINYIKMHPIHAVHNGPRIFASFNSLEIALFEKAISMPRFPAIYYTR